MSGHRRECPVWQDGKCTCAGMDQTVAKARRVAAAIALEHHHFHQQSVWSDGMLRSAACLIAEALKDHPGDDEVGGTGAA
jgi:hypothetical protein